jgi:hypothetical protein
MHRAKFLAAATLLAFACCSAPSTPAAPTVRPSASGASITVFPVAVAGRASSDAGNVVGILLERGGAASVEVADKPFVPEAGADPASEPVAFGRWIATSGVTTELALRVAIDGSPQTGVAGVRTMLVDRQGAVVFEASDAKGSPRFDAAAPKEPMDCCVFAVNSLRETLGLNDPLRGDAPTSKLQARMQQRAGVPDEKEAESMMQRLATLRAAGKGATIRVYPARVGDAWSSEAATALASRIGKSGLGTATAEPERLPFVTQRSPNQQAVLWSGARSIQQALRARGGTSDYALVCDFLPRGENAFGAVHTCLFAPDGSFVFVDYQNSHHDDFASVDPKTVDDCVEIAAMRVLGALRGD